MLKCSKNQEKLCLNIKCTICPERSFGYFNGLTRKGNRKVDCWDYERNNYILPYEIIKKSNTKYSFICDICNHLFSLSIQNIMSIDLMWCPYCKITTAKGGYLEEDFIKNYMNINTSVKKKFRSYFKTEYYTLSKIKGTHKVDISDGINCHFQVKKSKLNQFGQIARHSIDSFVKYIPDLSKIIHILKKWIEIPLKDDGKHIDNTYTKVKLTTSFFTEDELITLISTLNEKEIKKKIIELVLLGICKKLKPNYICVILYENDIRKKIIFYKMNDIIAYLLQFDFQISKGKTVIYLGDIFTLQRKGGDGGRKSSNNIQFKIIPSKLDIISNSLVINL